MKKKIKKIKFYFCFIVLIKINFLFEGASSKINKTIGKLYKKKN